MNKRRDHQFLRESIREIIVQEGFLDDIWSGIKKGAGKAYDFIASNVDVDIPKTSVFKVLDDLSKNDDPYDFDDNDHGMRTGDEDEDLDSDSSYEYGPIQGVTVSRGVEWSHDTKSFVERLRQILDPSIPLHITSAVRTPDTQARAMLKKLELGGPEEIRNVYGNKAKFFLAASPDAYSWANVVRDLQSRGLGFKSGHLAGNAIDIRTRNLSPEQIDNLESAVRSLGGNVLIEKNPPHMHVDDF